MSKDSIIALQNMSSPLAKMSMSFTSFQEFLKSWAKHLGVDFGSQSPGWRTPTLLPASVPPSLPGPRLSLAKTCCYQPQSPPLIAFHPAVSLLYPVIALIRNTLAGTVTPTVSADQRTAPETSILCDFKSGLRGCSEFLEESKGWCYPSLREDNGCCWHPAYWAIPFRSLWWSRGQWQLGHWSPGERHSLHQKEEAKGGGQSSWRRHNSSCSTNKPSRATLVGGNGALEPHFHKES